MRSAHRSQVRGPLAALVATLALLALIAGPTAAAVGDKYGTVAVIDASTNSETIVNGEPQVCDFYFVFDLNVQADVVGWVVKTWNATPLAGSTVLSGKGGPTDADGKLRQPDSGSLSLPDGRYNVIWDDESPVDSSNGHQSFTVSCEAPTQAPTATPTQAPTQAPTATPTGAVLPATGAPSGTPGGGVEAATGAARVTLPPTDAGRPSSTHGDATSSWLIVAGMGLLGFALMGLVPTWIAARKPIRRRPR